MVVPTPQQQAIIAPEDLPSHLFTIACPSYVLYIHRLISYATWNQVDSGIPPFATFAAAGFFLIPATHFMRCFHCGTTIFNWTPNADPWTLHAQLSPNCAYLILTKGSEFITRAQSEPTGLASLPTVDAATNTSPTHDTEEPHSEPEEGECTAPSSPA